MLNIGDNRNFQRLTGAAYFQPVGQAGMIPIGNIVLSKLDPKIERKDIMRFRGGQKILARTDVLGVNPEYQIEGDEINAVNLPILVWGAQGASLAQNASGLVSINIPAPKVGYTYPLGGLVNVTVLSASSTTPNLTLIQGQHYVLDAPKGLFTLQNTGDLPLTGTQVVQVQFRCAAVTRETFTPFTQLQQRGIMKLYEIDAPEDQTLPLHEITFPCTLYCESNGEAKVDDDQKFTLRARITGPMTMLRRVDDPALAV